MTSQGVQTLLLATVSPVSTCSELPIVYDSFSFTNVCAFEKRESPGFSVTARADYKRSERQKIPVCGSQLFSHLSLELSVKIILMSWF